MAAIKSPVPASERVRKSREKSGQKRITLWLNPSVDAELSDLASASGESRTAVINRLITESWTKKHE